MRWIIIVKNGVSVSPVSNLGNAAKGIKSPAKRGGPRAKRTDIRMHDGCHHWHGIVILVTLHIVNAMVLLHVQERVVGKLHGIEKPSGRGHGQYL